MFNLKRVVNTPWEQFNYISTLITPGDWAVVGIALLGLRHDPSIFSFHQNELRSITVSIMDSIFCKYGVFINFISFINSHI